MYKKTFLFMVATLVIAWHGFACAAPTIVIEEQPSLRETKHLEHSLEMFSKKIISKNKMTNVQYKRYGKQAMLSCDIIKPNEIVLMLYLLEYSHGEWRIAKEYHYTKGFTPPSSACS